ncbi:hypothetical protein Clacol_001001 [Clathrus columnatus]|uniref:Major facilitator superfamily (MFS) profile domain-containing protein n=1 Tax=Clathrus columnatus TaxID=1419009 RepID=A0AAV5A4I9_9AGAM|nr:hypothetical protein Clacol_001001 [Clathrus columnatus]
MSAPSNQERDRLNAALIILTCFSTTVLSSFCVSGPSIALPAIGHDLGLSQTGLQWICNAFALSSGCFLLLFGRLADIHGRKLTFLLGTAMTGIFSLACGFARTKLQIIIFRALQGMGGAASVPAALGILAQTFPPSSRRSIAFAVFSAGNPFGSGLGYILGAVAGQYSPIRWRAIFFIASGMAAFSFISALLVFKSDRPGKDIDRRVDWLGATFITMGLASILFVLGQGGMPVKGLDSGYYLAKRPACRPPLMRLDLWSRANGKFAAMQGIAFLEWLALKYIR